jgi:hypothetical protein
VWYRLPSTDRFMTDLSISWVQRSTSTLPQETVTSGGVALFLCDRDQRVDEAEGLDEVLERVLAIIDHRPAQQLLPQRRGSPPGQRRHAALARDTFAVGKVHATMVANPEKRRVECQNPRVKTPVFTCNCLR